MKDVAREAGVALGTVSKVVNGIPVGESYRLKVEQAIQKLNYEINTYAQGLKSNVTNTIAFLVPNTIDPFFAKLTYYINQSLLKRNYKMLLCTTEYDFTQEQEYINMARQNKVDGIIGLTYNPNLVLDESSPFVAIDRPMGENIPCVASDNFAGGQLAAEKLADLGCRKVAFLRIGSALNNETNKRKAGFENGCSLRNLEYEVKVFDDGHSLDEFIPFLKEHINSGKPSLDGIFCVTDRLACFIIEALRSLNIQVPEDIQVIGFDGIRHFGNGPYVCSSIKQPIRDIAETCVQLILQENLTTKQPLICLPVKYVYGNTTKVE